MEARGGKEGGGKVGHTEDGLLPYCLTWPWFCIKHGSQMRRKMKKSFSLPHPETEGFKNGPNL
jgi:hypothetical protein